MFADAAIIQLTELLASGRLAGRSEKSGKRLLQRIGSPVRIAIMGLPGSGKSELLNYLVGRRIVPPNANLPMLEIAFGEQSRVLVTGQDGNVEQHDGLKLDRINKASAAFVKIESNLPSLKNICFLEVEAGTAAKDQAGAMDWATRRSDILLWCSQGFSEVERKLWSRVPDDMKDHSFFILNHADTLTAQGVISDRIAALQRVVVEEFYGLLPIATPQAITANERKDAEMLKASGGAALKQAISKQVDSGRRADLDSMLLFLNRYDIAPISGAKVKTKVTSETPKVMPTKPAAPELPVVDSVEVDVENSEQINVIALQFLQKSAAELNHTDSTAVAADILAQCNEISSHLADLYAETSDSPELQEDFFEAAELMVLMQLEEDDGAAADAVSLLLQLKRGIEQKLAA